MVELSAIVLAAGASTRMGKQKLALPFDKTNILQHVIAQLKKAGIAEVVVVVNQETYPLVADIPEIVIALNENHHNGMTSTIQAGVKMCHENTKGYMICMSDMPAISADIYEGLANRFIESQQQNKHAIVVPFFDGKRGQPVIFSAFYRQEILNHPEPEGCKGILIQHESEWVKHKGDSPAVLHDIDTPDDYQEALKAMNQSNRK